MPAIRAALRELDPAQPIFQPRTIQKMVSDWSVEGRTREISVRMALGAQPGAVTFLGVPLVLLADVAVSFYSPARRAIRTDLIKGLQYE